MYTQIFFEEKDTTDAMASVFLLKNRLTIEKTKCKIFEMLSEQLKIWLSKSKVSDDYIISTKKVLGFRLTRMFFSKDN